MRTECKSNRFKFQALGNREVLGQFDGGTITSDGGGVLLRELERRAGILKRFSECFTDFRNSEKVEHPVFSLVCQRIYGLALGYEDLNDHDILRSDPLMAVLCERDDPTGSHRKRESDQGKALAGKSTLNRLELTKSDADEKSRYKKIVLDSQRVDDLLLDVFIESYKKVPSRIILDLDATDDPVHGNQEGRFFHGYYKEYCYLPLYIFCGEALLCARLRPSNIDASEGSIEELTRIVNRIRLSWPDVEIIIRGDSGFCREQIMSWCEENHVGYVLGLAKNSRLVEMIKEELTEAEVKHQETGKASRIYADFYYQTRDSWRCARRVIGKAEFLSKGANPRFVVTSLSGESIDGADLYERMYCARGDMENRIKEQQLYLFADRTSTGQMRSNQIRLYFSSIAYVLLSALRRIGLKGTELAKAQCQTIRLKLLKVGAQIRVTFRKVWLSFAEGYPDCGLFEKVYRNIRHSFG